MKRRLHLVLTDTLRDQAFALMDEGLSDWSVCLELGADSRVVREARTLWETRKPSTGRLDKAKKLE